MFHGDLGGRSETNPPPGARTLLKRVERSRGFGDFFQHVLVAQGAGEVAVDPEVSPWDIAPLAVIVEEAGGRATSLQGDPTIYAGSLLTSNGLLHDEAVAVLAHDPEVRGR
jgi:histidinol-phosphatase